MKFTIMICIIVSPVILLGQLEVERSVMSSGGHFINSQLKIDGTIGEVIIGENTMGDLKVTSGFHQTIRSTTPTNSFQLNEVAIYPNPTNGWINMESSSKITEIKAVDITGKLVYRRQSENGIDLSHNLTHLDQGTYILILSIGDHHINKKFVKVD